MVVLQVLLHHVAVPTVFLLWLAVGRPGSRLQWLATAAVVGAYISFVVITGAWAWVGYPLRIVVLVLLGVALAVSHRRSLPWRRESSWKAGLDTGFRVLLALLFSAGALYGLAGYRTPEETVELAFPLRGRAYVVGQGGATPVINHHNRHPSQRYALDIVGLNTLGMRARGLLPADLERYAIFDDPVHSPCAGEVVHVIDGLEDHVPPARDEERPAGNAVTLECGPVVVHLAHLRNGSVRVEVGDRVDAGQLLGRVGNSGNTSEPHLHIHAERGPYTGKDGPGVPMRFGGRFLVRNSLIR